MRSDRYRPDQPPFLLYGLLGASLVTNLFLVVDRAMDRTDVSDEPVVEEVVDAELAPATIEPAAPAAATPTPAAATDLRSVALSAPVVDPGGVAGDTDRPGGWQFVRTSVENNLAYTFAQVLDEGSDAVTAVFTRQFVFDLEMRRDLQKGDEVVALFKTDKHGNIEMPVAWLDSKKHGKTFKAYRFQAPGDTFASYWTPDGIEVPLRLVGGPIEDYEQITSLVGDGRRHAGMDFKAPVGTDIVAPKGATVSRTNWNTAANGRCVELRYADGVVAKFLHLEDVSVSAGQHVRPGQVLGKSGNTGRSTAPHLHYQLNKGKKVVDPLTYHDTVRRQLAASSMDALASEVARWDALMGEDLASL